MQRLMRKLSQSDLSQVINIENQAFSHPWPADAFSESILQHSRGLEVDGRLCGYIFYHVIMGEAVILNFAIDPQLQRQGHGEYLLLESLKELSRQGCTHFYLDVRESNIGAIKLYAKHGFVPLGKRKLYYSNPDEDALVMGLIIHSQGDTHDL
jgi:[ribosomal protein S18]-alanine N-acetyltransferase